MDSVFVNTVLHAILVDDRSNTVRLFKDLVILRTVARNLSLISTFPSDINISSGVCRNVK